MGEPGKLSMQIPRGYVVVVALRFVQVVEESREASFGHHIALQ